MNKKGISKAVLTVILSLPSVAFSSQGANENPYHDPSVSLKSQAHINSEAKKSWMDDSFPISSDDISKYIDKSSDLERAYKPAINSKLIKKSLNVNPNKAQDYPEVITAVGFNTALTFWDSSGNPWDIEYVASGNRTQFFVDQPAGIKHKNIIILNPRTQLARTNLTISLKDEKNPLTVQVTTNDFDTKSNIAYGEVAINLMKINPSAEVPSIQVDTSFLEGKADSSVLLSFIDELPPKEAVVLDIKGSGDDLKGWVYKNYFYIKTSQSLIWPPTDSIQQDGSNSRVYKTSKTPLLRLTNLATGATKNYEVHLNE